MQDIVRFAVEVLSYYREDQGQRKDARCAETCKRTEERPYGDDSIVLREGAFLHSATLHDSIHANGGKRAGPPMWDDIDKVGDAPRKAVGETLYPTRDGFRQGDRPSQYLHRQSIEHQGLHM